MSQAGIINVSGGGGGGSPIETITGNDGVPTPPTANNVNIIGLTVSNATNAIPVYVKHTATSTDSIEVQVAEAVGSSNINNAGLASFNSANFTVDANGYVSAVAATDLHTARYIVSAGGASDGANFTTIASAITAAVSAGGNQTVFIQPGTYTENLTLASGVSLTAFPCDTYNPSVTIVGKATATFAGTCSISGICLQTNGDNALTATGSANTVLNLIGCNIKGTNAVAIDMETSGASAALNLYNCIGDKSAALSGLFASGNSYVGSVFMKGCKFTNSNGSNVSSAFAGSTSLSIYECDFFTPISTSLSASALVANSIFDTRAAANGGCGFNGAGNTILYNCTFLTDAASCFASSQTVTATHCTLNSSATNVITGAGTLKYGLLVFSGSSSAISISTQTPLATLI